MATMFIQQSEEYVRQIDAEIERLQQLREQVLLILQPEEDAAAYDEQEPEEVVEEEPEAPTRRPAKKSPGKKAVKAPAKRNRTKPTPVVEE